MEGGGFEGDMTVLPTIMVDSLSHLIPYLTKSFLNISFSSKLFPQSNMDLDFMLDHNVTLASLKFLQFYQSPFDPCAFIETPLWTTQRLIA